MYVCIMCDIKVYKHTKVTARHFVFRFINTTVFTGLMLIKVTTSENNILCHPIKLLSYKLLLFTTRRIPILIHARQLLSNRKNHPTTYTRDD